MVDAPPIPAVDMLRAHLQRKPNADQLPKYVKDAMRGLTPVQRKSVIAGYIASESMETVRALKRRALFYLKINSPNGRCGVMELTPLGVTVQGILKARAQGAK